ncbi:hypothetical protein CTA1_4185 [Colletotrichum tanaceti]|uniref:Uncharacterized protein n=1 Tax=Colletotrichum tanaceti TaxID=1306861 RepID=A0A4U6XU53_9PEZI|nr:hypothetical protein CTA1_4185 [Colletotrichum tanaceti]
MTGTRCVTSIDELSLDSDEGQSAYKTTRRHLSRSTSRPVDVKRLEKLIYNSSQHSLMLQW